MRLRPRYPGMLLLAIILACLLWYGTARDRRERVSERQVDAPVTLVNVPPQMVITSDVPRTLTVRLRGPLSRLRDLDPSQVGVVVDLRGVGEGEHEFTIESNNVVVPDGVEVVAVSPAEVPLRLERLVHRMVPVRPRVMGEPAEGFEIGKVEVSPPAVEVSGPRLQVGSLQALATDPVSVSGADSPVESLVTVRSPGSLARVENPLAVRVTVDIVPVEREPREGKKR
jgi:YbbR domain-containing protein